MCTPLLLLPLYALKIACHLSLENSECSFQKTPFLLNNLHNAKLLIITAYGNGLFFYNFHNIFNIHTSAVHILLITSSCNAIIFSHLRNGCVANTRQFTQLAFFHISINQQLPKFLITYSLFFISLIRKKESLSCWQDPK